MEQYINSQDIRKPIEDIIYQSLLEMKTNENSVLRQKMQELISMYNVFKQEEQVNGLIQFHDTTRFNTGGIHESLFQQYTSLRKREIDRVGKAKIIDEMYNKILEIVSLIRDDENINYAVYFNIKNKVYRSFVGVIPSRLLQLDNTEGSVKYQMQINAAKFKEWATAKSQNRSVDITEHYNAFMKTLQDTYRGKTFPNRRINNGHIAEAFERHLQGMHRELASSNKVTLPATYDWSVGEAWQLIRISLGNDPWYTGGDVNNIQVKSLFAGDRTVTSYETIEDMFNFLRYLLDYNVSEQVLKRKAKEACNVFYNKVEDTLNETIDMEVDEIIKELTI